LIVCRTLRGSVCLPLHHCGRHALPQLPSRVRFTGYHSFLHSLRLSAGVCGSRLTPTVLTNGSVRICFVRIFAPPNTAHACLRSARFSRGFGSTCRLVYLFYWVTHAPFGSHAYTHTHLRYFHHLAPHTGSTSSVTTSFFGYRFVASTVWFAVLRSRGSFSGLRSHHCLHITLHRFASRCLTRLGLHSAFLRTSFACWLHCGWLPFHCTRFLVHFTVHTLHTRSGCSSGSHIHCWFATSFLLRLRLFHRSFTGYLPTPYHTGYALKRLFCRLPRTFTFFVRFGSRTLFWFVPRFSFSTLVWLRRCTRFVRTARALPRSHTVTAHALAHARTLLCTGTYTTVRLHVLFAFHCLTHLTRFGLYASRCLVGYTGLRGCVGSHFTLCSLHMPLHCTPGSALVRVYTLPWHKHRCVAHAYRTGSGSYAQRFAFGLYRKTPAWCTYTHCTHHAPLVRALVLVLLHWLHTAPARLRLCGSLRATLTHHYVLPGHAHLLRLFLLHPGRFRGSFLFLLPFRSRLRITPLCTAPRTAFSRWFLCLPRLQKQFMVHFLDTSLPVALLWFHCARLHCITARTPTLFGSARYHTHSLVHSTFGSL